MSKIEQFKEEITLIIANAVREDVGDGDHSSLACIPKDAKGKAKLLVKENGIISGIEIAKKIFKTYDNSIEFLANLEDGENVKIGDIAFIVNGSSRSLLTIERLVLNVMQRMSGISTLSSRYASELIGLPTKILDTRKTTPGFRFFEKW